ncbi:MAG TPA: hypothetical protein VM328_06425 [Fimbriimonadaceae bacterium]|nr:hypothetical protein [Fimbriimonadaceae bacterium]
MLAALAVAVVAIGAFQFSGDSSPAPAPTEKKAGEEKPAEPVKDKLVASAGPINPLFAGALPPRDPFKAGVLPGMTPPSQPEPPQPEPEPPRPRQQRPPREFGAPPSGFEPIQLPGLGDGIKVEPEPEVFGYTLSGVVLGDTPAAVFTDGSGNQRLVTHGAALDGDSRVVGISRGKVTVRWKNKTMTLTLGGTADAK